MNMFISVAMVMACLVAGGHCGLTIRAAEEHINTFPVSFEGDNENMDFESLQTVKKQAGEVEMDEGRDSAFEEEMFDNNGRPKNPSSAEIMAVYEKNKESVYKQAYAGGIDLNRVSIRPQYPFVSYMDKLTWKPALKCCPRSWGYGCRHVNTRMPCFSNYHQNVKEWCCPLFPGVYTARCSCDKCHIQTSTCIHQGRCQKRYSKRNFLAVCYRNGWHHLRFFSKWLPSSCYCSAKYPYEVMSQEKSCQ